MKKILSLTLFLFVFLSWGNYRPQAMAQTSIGLTVSPPISYLQVPPGATRSHTIVLENNGDKAITVLPSIVDFSSDGKTGRAVISDKLSFPYITFGTSEIKELSIPAHKKAQLTLYIDVPKDADEKEYPLTVLFLSKEDEVFPGINSPNKSSSYSQITGGIGSNLVVLISKKNKFSRILEVIDLNTPRFVDSFGKIEFLPLVRNESLASIAASGSAKILNWNKNTLAEFEIYPDIVLSTSSRELRALRPGVTLDKPETGAFSYKPKFLLGPYQIAVDIESNQENSFRHIEVIYALPFSIMFVVIIGIIITTIYHKRTTY